MRAARLLAVALLGAAVLGACDDERRAVSRDDLPELPEDPTATVDVDADGFDPASLEVTTEDLVEFRNAGDEEHGVRTEDFAIDTGPLFAGERTLVVFDEPGDYVVYDTEADDSSMTVTVSEPTASG